MGRNSVRPSKLVGNADALGAAPYGRTPSFAAFLNSSGNFARKLWVGQEQASPKAQTVRPAMLSATFLSTAGSLSAPSPSSMRVVILDIHRLPSRHGVHWPQLSCA